MYQQYILKRVKKVLTCQCMTTMVRERGWNSIIFMLTCFLVVMFMAGLWEDLFAIVRIPSPLPLSMNKMYPSRVPLLDLPNFAYVINNDVCESDDVYAVVIIHTHPANREVRDIWRKNVPDEDLRDLAMRRVFLLARAEWDDQELYSKTPQWRITQESAEFHDIVQGNFKEHYHNLTYKHVMGLQWVTKYCSQAKFVIKMDDDIGVDLYQFRDKLKTRYREKKNLILGLLQVEAKPVRDKASKWYVTKEEYVDKYYASFVSGWVYAMTIDAATAIVDESFKRPYFWIDDVHVTGTLAAAVGVRREGFNHYYTIHVEHMLCCLDLPNSADYYCDFLAGPTEDDLDLLARVLQHARSCYINPCQRRPLEASVAKMCVRAKSSNPLGPVGHGRGEIIRVS